MSMAVIKKKIVVFGVTGQDGSFLKELYEDAEVYGFARGVLNCDTDYRCMDLSDVEISDLAKILTDIDPDLIYNFAGQSSVGISFKNPGETFTSNYLSHFKLLESCVTIGFTGRIYSALSSEMIGKGILNLDTGDLTCLPVSPYGLSKFACYNLNKVYREKCGLNIVDGILFNHESGRRRSSFLFGKILDYIRSRKKSELILGDLSVKRNFGHAKQYMEKIKNHMHEDSSDLCICLTEKDYTLHEMVDLFIQEADLNPNQIIWNNSAKRPQELDLINVIGDRSSFLGLQHGPQLVKTVLQESYDIS
jgi:GDPmannose 4,6-dehydratase